MANSLEMVGGLLVEVDVSSVDKAIAKLKQLEQSTTSLQSSLNKLSNTNIDIKANTSSVGGAAKSLHALTDAANKTKSATSGISQGIGEIANAAGKSINPLAGMGGALSALAAMQIGRIAAIAVVLKTIGQPAYDAYQPIQSLRMGLDALGQNGTIAVMNLRNQASSLGVVFSETAKAQLQWNAAIKDTSLEGEKGAKVFQNVAGTIRLFGGGTEEVQGSMRALTQMMNKGTIQAEELKGQLGERMPGAINLMADALGLTTRELQKLMKDGLVESGYALEQFSNLLETKYGSAMHGAANTTQAVLNRMKNDFNTILSGIGAVVDSFVGKVAKAFEWLGILSGAANSINFISNSNALYNLGVGQGVKPGAGVQQVWKEINILLEREGLPQLKMREGFKTAPDSPTGGRIVANLLAGVINELNDKKRTAERTGDRRTVDEVDATLKVIQAQIKARSNPNAVYDRARGGVNATKESQDFLANRRAAEEMADALRTNNERRRLELEKQDNLDKLEKVRNVMSPQKFAEYEKDVLLKNARIDGRLKAIDDRATKSGVAAAGRANNAAEHAAQRMNNILGQGDSYKAAIGYKLLDLVGPTDIDGQIQKISDHYDDLIKKIEEEKNLTDEQKKDAKERLETTKKEAIEEEKKLNDAKKRRDFEADITKYRERAANSIERERDHTEKFNFERKESYNSMMEGLGTQGVVLSKYARARQDFIKANSDDKAYREELIRQKQALADLDKEFTDARVEARKDKGLSEFAELPDEDKKIEAAMNYNNRKRGLEAKIASTQKEQSRRLVAVMNAYNEDYAAKHKLSYGVNSGAGEYIDSIKSKAERAHEATVLLGQSLTSVFMATSTSQALDSGKNFFKSLLLMIRQTIVELKIVKPLIDAIQTSAGKEGGFLNTILNGAGDWVGKYFGSGGAKPVVSEGASKISGEFTASLFAANGAAFGGGVRYFATGGVFDKPTAFQYGANNLGILGEAGPEAILPLKRNSRGALGVQMDGAASQSQTITIAPVININGNAQKEDAVVIAQRTAEQMRAVVREEMMKANRPGGMYRK